MDCLLFAVTGMGAFLSLDGFLDRAIPRGFAFLLVVLNAPLDKVCNEIDWSILLFFGALFIAVDVFARSGIVAWVFERIPLIVAEKSERFGGLGFREYLRAGVPIAIVTTAIGTAWLVGSRWLF